MSPIWETKIDPADDDVIADTRDADTAMLMRTLVLLMMLVLMTVTTTVGDKVVRHSLGDRPTHGTQFRQ